ncbi:translation initiation factor IF-2-like [Vulpes lagopus]|uniref:translation initiation factor IF-2-like n=1 Tax=Vulpes lagopus TaxID=494514 RepID=UPI001BC9D4CB|nr:translation initiation factor IF-2-like [Vulpes lagopus]
MPTTAGTPRVPTWGTEVPNHSRDILYADPGTEDADHSEDIRCADPGGWRTLTTVRTPLCTDPGTEDADHSGDTSVAPPPPILYAFLPVSRLTANPDPQPIPVLLPPGSPAPRQSQCSFLRSPASLPILGPTPARPALRLARTWRPVVQSVPPARPGRWALPVVENHCGSGARPFLSLRPGRAAGRRLGRRESRARPRGPRAAGGGREGRVGRARAGAPRSVGRRRESAERRRASGRRGPDQRTARGLPISVSSRRSASWLADHRQRAFSPKPRRETGDTLGSGNARVRNTVLPSGGAAGMASRTDSPRDTGPCS